MIQIIICNPENKQKPHHDPIDRTNHYKKTMCKDRDRSYTMIYAGEKRTRNRTDESREHK